MRIKLTNKAERGIGLRSMSTGKLTRYEAGDVLEVSDNTAIGLVNSGLATEVEATEDNSQQNSDDEEQDADERSAAGQYDNKTKEELIAICKEHGTTSRGTKKELIARLTEE